MPTSSPSKLNPLTSTSLKAFVASVALFASTASLAEERVTLRLSHFWPSSSAIHKQIYQVWADEIKNASNGRLNIEIYPSSTLAKAPAQYDAVKKSIADITATVQGYTANRFPLTQIVELPNVVTNAQQGSCIVQTLYDEKLISEEYQDTHPLFLFTHGPGSLHLKDKSVKTPADLNGLRIRRPTTLVAQFLESVGAQAVGMPGPESYQSMQRGVIDGVGLPWEGVVGFRLNELVKTHTEIGGLYSVAFIVTMNQQSYDKLPDDLKKILDEHSGPKWSQLAAKVFDGLDEKGRAEAVARGDEITTIDPKGTDWQPLLDQSKQDYISQLNGKGLAADKVYARTLELAKSCAN